VIGVSAGTGVAAFALEALKEGAQVTRTVLLSSSLQSRYDLSPALAHVRDRLYVFTNSAADVVLSAGVMAAGTVDRGGMAAGGLFGFSPPEGASEAVQQMYKDKLIQISWGPGDILLTNPGDHLGPTRSTFVRERVAPLVLGLAPGEKPAKAPAKSVKKKPKTPPPTKRAGVRPPEEP
jgi:hypothetical protein